MVDKDDMGVAGVGAPDDDDPEATSVIGPEERRVLLAAARAEANAAPAETPREEDFARTTARPPGSGSEQDVVLPPAPRAPRLEEAAETSVPVAQPTVVAQPPVRREPRTRVWAVVAFVALVAAVAYAIQS